MIQQDLRLHRPQPRPQTSTNEETLHPLLPSLPPTNYTPAAKDLLSRVTLSSTSSDSVPVPKIDHTPHPPPDLSQEGEQKGAEAEGGGEWIDTTRYSSLPTTSTSSTSTSIKDLQSLQINATHLHTRHLNLSLLASESGKNAWLVGNSQLEDVLRELEKELVSVRGEVEGVNAARRDVQRGGEGSTLR